MLNSIFTSPHLIGGWTIAGALVAASPMMDANHSTMALALALCITVVTTLLALNAPSQSLTQLLPAVDIQEGRS